MENSSVNIPSSRETRHRSNSTNLSVFFLEICFGMFVGGCECSTFLYHKNALGGDFKDFLFSPLAGEMIQFD